VLGVTKKEIINAAFRVWGRNFYRKTSLSQLAGELGVSKPALYRHFVNKQALTAAMTEQFMDDFASSIRAEFENALLAKDADEGVSAIVRSISDYFARNAYALIFSLMNIYNRYLDSSTLTEQLKIRGADLAVLQVIAGKKYISCPTVVRMVFSTLTFFISHFHKTNNSMENPPPDQDIQNIISAVYKIVKCGLKFPVEKTELDFDKLEKLVEKIEFNTEIEPFFKAVAEAVAEAGPWDVSMDMVAKRLGLCKSSLYGHFKNKKDMLRRLFISEFKRIIEFARKGISMSANTAEQLYLGIYSITIYLRSRPEILIAMDWIRTRKLDLGKPDKNLEIFRLFEDIDIEPLRNATEEEKQRISHWILFSLINILTNPNPFTKNTGLEKSEYNNFVFIAGQEQNNDIRVLYKFITSGLGGFIK
jgi:AcrR family transcriptional regulator